MATDFASDGFDLDAVAASSSNPDEVVYEIGGGATAVASDTTSAQEPVPANDKAAAEDDDPTAESERCKSQGNERFKAADYPAAYDFYTRAIESCPGMTGSELLQLRDDFEDKQREEAYQRRRDEQDRRLGNSSPSTPNTNENDNTSSANQQPPEQFQPPPHPHSDKLTVYHCNRAACLLHMERYDDAVEDCDVALLWNPKYVKALIRRMTAFEKTEKTEEALRDAKAALELDPANATTRRHVARLQKLEDERLEKLKAETMDKLKDLGNSILGNFGLSLDNFKAEKDPNTGSYNISFQNNP